MTHSSLLFSSRPSPFGLLYHRVDGLETSVMEAEILASGCQHRLVRPLLWLAHVSLYLHIGTGAFSGVSFIRTLINPQDLSISYRLLIPSPLGDCNHLLVPLVFQFINFLGGGGGAQTFRL